MKIEIEIEDCNIHDYKEMLKDEQWKNRGFKMTPSDMFNEMIASFKVNNFWGMLGRYLAEHTHVWLIQKKDNKNVVAIGDFEIFEIDDETFKKMAGAKLLSTHIEEIEGNNV